MAETESTCYNKLMNAGNRIGGPALSTDQIQALGMTVIAQQLVVLNENIEILIEELRIMRERMP